MRKRQAEWGWRDGNNRNGPGGGRPVPQPGPLLSRRSHADKRGPESLRKYIESGCGGRWTLLPWIRRPFEPCWWDAVVEETGEGREGFGSEVSVVVLSRSTWTFLGFVGAATPWPPGRGGAPPRCGPVGVATGWSGSSLSGPGWSVEGWVGRESPGLKRFSSKLR